MKQIIATALIMLTFISCATTNELKEKRCKKLLKNDYNNILVDKFKSILDKDTVRLNEVKYECVHSAFYIQKGMFDRFGKWDKAIFIKGETQPILLWNNIKLFANDTITFTVAANGKESKKNIYASALVFDNKNYDMLADNSVYKTKLITYFSELIKSQNMENKDFYEAYWKNVNPKYWEKIKPYVTKD